MITTGAGFSADSGLQTYECAPAEYRDMCNPIQLVNKPLQFQQFWLRFTQSYLETQPHIGYELLDQWCHGGLLKHLTKLSHDIESPWYVYTSNVDHHFAKFKSFQNTLCEIHGSALAFRCACGIGFASGEPRLGKDWDSWNQNALSTDSCKQLSTIQMSQNLVEEILNSNEVVLCSHCKQPMRPNVLMFHDTDDNVLKEINWQRERYQEWEASVEDKVATQGNLVLLEIGCGTKVPAVRRESEEVFLDSAKKIQSQKRSEGSVCLIRINPKDAEIKLDGGDKLDTISISSTAADAIQKSDYWLKAFAEQ